MGVCWIINLRKDELQAILKEFRLVTMGPVEELRSRLATFLGGNTHVPAIREHFTAPVSRRQVSRRPVSRKHPHLSRLLLDQRRPCQERETQGSPSSHQKCKPTTQRTIFPQHTRYHHNRRSAAQSEQYSSAKSFGDGKFSLIE